MKVYGIDAKVRLGCYCVVGTNRIVTEWGGKDERRMQRKRARREGKKACREQPL